MKLVKRLLQEADMIKTIGVGGTHTGITRDVSHLSVERLLAGQLVFQFIFYVVERRRLPLGTQVPANQNKTADRRSSEWRAVEEV